MSVYAQCVNRPQARRSHGAGRSPRRQSGLAALEFALFAVLLVPFLVLTYELGRLVYWDSALVNAARAGAQHGVRAAPITWSRASLVDQIKVASVLESDGILTADKVTVAISCACPGDNTPTAAKCSLDLGGDLNQFYCNDEGPPKVYLSVEVAAAMRSEILPNAVAGLINLVRNVTLRLQ